MMPENLGPQSLPMQASLQTAAEAGAHLESQASAEAGGTEGIVSVKPGVSREQDSAKRSELSRAVTHSLSSHTSSLLVMNFPLFSALSFILSHPKLCAFPRP